MFPSRLQIISSCSLFDRAEPVPLIQSVPSNITFIWVYSAKRAVYWSHQSQRLSNQSSFTFSPLIPPPQGQVMSIREIYCLCRTTCYERTALYYLSLTKLIIIQHDACVTHNNMARSCQKKITSINLRNHILGTLRFYALWNYLANLRSILPYNFLLRPIIVIQYFGTKKNSFTTMIFLKST